MGAFEKQKETIEVYTEKFLLLKMILTLLKKLLETNAQLLRNLHDIKVEEFINENNPTYQHGPCKEILPSSYHESLNSTKRLLLLLWLWLGSSPDNLHLINIYTKYVNDQP